MSESCSVVPNSLRPHRLHSPWNSPGQNTGVGGYPLFPFPGDLPDPGMEPRSPALQVDSLLAEPQGKSFMKIIIITSTSTEKTFDKIQQLFMI